MQSQQNSMLQIYLIIFSLVLAFLASFGFSLIKAGAEEMAIKKAEEISKTMVENFLEENSKKLNLGKPSFPYSKDKTNEHGASHDT